MVSLIVWYRVSSNLPGLRPFSFFVRSFFFSLFVFFLFSYVQFSVRTLVVFNVKSMTSFHHFVVEIHLVHHTPQPSSPVTIVVETLIAPQLLVFFVFFSIVLLILLLRSCTILE